MTTENQTAEIESTDVQVTPAQALEALKARADVMGIKYHPSISFDKLSEKVTAALEGKKEDDEEVVKTSDKANETVMQKRKRLFDEAMALVRVRVVCMDPAKSEYEGETFTIGNSIIPTYTKYVPFNNDEGWHIPKIMLDNLKERQTQVFVTERRNGKEVKVPKLIRTYAIEVLPPLTEEERKELAIRQANNRSID